MIIVNTTINGKNVIVKHSPSEFSTFINDYTIECYELYIDGSYMDNYADLDALNDYVNDYFEVA